MHHHSIIKIATSGWGMYGFYRGTQHYSYTYNEDMEKYNQKLHFDYNKDMERYNDNINKYPTICFHKPVAPIKPTKFYMTSMLYGLAGSFLYLYPVTGVIYIFKEIYRLEINVRGIDDAKKTSYYNSLEI